MNKGKSKLVNPTIAKAFYDMNYIEKWASGIPMMRKECELIGIPYPEH